MKTTVIRVVVALVLAAGAWICWREARIVDRAADARMALSLLRYDAIDGEAREWMLSDVVGADARPLATEARRDLAIADYWLGRYADVMDVGRQEIDSDLLWMAANASFRTSQRDGHIGQPAVQRLDGVLQAYASVLKAAPEHADAAYNYEFVARVRDAVARAAATKTKPETLTTPVPATRAQAGDLPSGPTLHGQPGAPPPEVKAEDFKIIAPMEFGDREAQPEPTPGGKLPRKG